MTNSASNIKETKEIHTDNETSTGSKLKFLALEIFSVLLWVYITIKLLVTEIDIALISYFSPKNLWILELKFFIIIGLVALALILLKTKEFLILIFYSLFYPFIFLLWKVPYFIFKQKSWLLLFALINACVSFLKHGKFNFIMYTLFLIAVAIIFNANNSLLVYFSIAIVLTFLTIVYIRKSFSIFKPSSIFETYKNIFRTARETETFTIKDDIKDLPVDALNDKQLSARNQSLQMSVLYNRVCLFTAMKLRDYQKSDLTTIVSIMTILLLILLTTFCFATVNYGLFIISPSNFEISNSEITFFTFFYYSFNAFLFNFIDGLKPELMPAQAFHMLENFFALFLIVIFVSLLITVRRKRHEQELDELIEEISYNGCEMEAYIKSEYKLKNIQDAISELEKVKSDMIEIIYKISENIR